MESNWDLTGLFAVVNTALTSIIELPARSFKEARSTAQYLCPGLEGQQSYAPRNGQEQE